MKTVTATARRYDNVTIFFHWASALLVITQWLGAQTIDWFPRGPMRVDARSVHITFGVLLALILVARIIWRLTGGRRLPPVDQGVLNFVAKATHWALYALLAAMVSVGMLLAWARGDSIFNLFSLPAYDAGNPTFSHQMQDVHATIGWIILALAGLHAGAALVHRYVWQDGVLGRMLPTTTEEDI
jgi:cytochrome b561